MYFVSSYFPVQSFVSSVVAVVLFFTEDEDEAGFPFSTIGSDVDDASFQFFL